LRIGLNTVNSNLRVLHRVLNKAVEWHNPKKGVFLLEKSPAFDTLKGANKRDRDITAKEELTYLKKAKAKSSLLTDFVSTLLILHCGRRKIIVFDGKALCGKVAYTATALSRSLTAKRTVRGEKCR
jgi:hypothetical protein